MFESSKPFQMIRIPLARRVCIINEKNNSLQAVGSPHPEAIVLNGFLEVP